MVRAWLRQLGKKWIGGARNVRAAKRAGRLGVEALEAREVMTVGLLPTQHLGGPGGQPQHALITPSNAPDKPPAAAPLPGGAAAKAERGPLSLPSAFDRAFPPQAGPAARDGGPRLDLGDAKVGDLVYRVKEGDKISDVLKDLFGERATDAGVSGPKLAELFRDAGRYHRLLAQAFGEGYDRAEADRLRAQALKGDFSFLPPARFLNRDTLLGHHAAYNAADGIVYLARDLKGNPAQLRAAYLEELGHHLDRRLNTADTKGDEGELFRRLASGERLTARQLAHIRAENDAGVITVDGRQVQVEFFFKKIAKAVGNAVSDAANAVGDAANAVADAASSVVSDVVGAAKEAASDVADAAKEVGQGFVNAARTIGNAVVNDLGKGFIGGLLKGDVGGALNSAINGVSNLVFGAPNAIANGVLNGVENVLNAGTRILGDKVGGAAREVISRGTDIVRTVKNAGSQIVETIVRTPLEVGASVVGGAADAAKDLVKGKLADAGKKLGGGILGGIAKIPGAGLDITLIAAQAGATVVGDLLPWFEPSRALNTAETDFLKRVYGSSLNTGVLRLHIGDISHEARFAPHTLGNEIYIPRTSESGATVYVTAKDKLTPAGLQLLAHEAAHAWQSQTGGNSYIHESVWAQGKAVVEHGDRDVAYEHHPDIIAGKAFEKLNPEQQAEVIEDIAQVLAANPTLKFEDMKDAGKRMAAMAQFAAVIDAERANLMTPLPGLTNAEFSRILGAWAHVRSGGKVSSSSAATKDYPLTAAAATPLKSAGQGLKAAAAPAAKEVLGGGRKPAAIAAPVKAVVTPAAAAPAPKPAAKPVAATPLAPKPVGSVINLGPTIAFTKRK